jgi:hypothetical protein
MPVTLIEKRGKAVPLTPVGRFQWFPHVCSLPPPSPRQVKTTILPLPTFYFCGGPYFFLAAGGGYADPGSGFRIGDFNSVNGNEMSLLKDFSDPDHNKALKNNGMADQVGTSFCPIYHLALNLSRVCPPCPRFIYRPAPARGRHVV